VHEIVSPGHAVLSPALKILSRAHDTFLRRGKYHFKLCTHEILSRAQEILLHSIVNRCCWSDNDLGYYYEFLLRSYRLFLILWIVICYSSCKAYYNVSMSLAVETTISCPRDSMPCARDIFLPVCPFAGSVHIVRVKYW